MAQTHKEGMDMPGQIYIDAARTFAAVLAMSAGPKLAYGTENQDITKDGERKWVISAAVQYHAAPGDRVVSEVIDVTLIGGDQVPAVKPGEQIEFTDLRMGISAPQARENGKGISGGRPWFQCSGVRAASSFRPGKSAEAA